MARVVLASTISKDFARILDHLATFEVGSDRARIDGIIKAIGILADSPFIGRAVGGGRRELVIGSGASGFVALYRFEAQTDTVSVLAIRNQRESGYRRRR